MSMTATEAEDIIEKLSSKCMTIDTQFKDNHIVIKAKEYTGHITISPCVHRYIIKAVDVRCSISRTGFLDTNVNGIMQLDEIEYCNRCNKVFSFLEREEDEDKFESKVASNYDKE